MQIRYQTWQLYVRSVQLMWPLSQMVAAPYVNGQVNNRHEGNNWLLTYFYY